MRDLALPVTEMEEDEAGCGTRSKDHLCIHPPATLLSNVVWLSRLVGLLLD